MIRNSIYVLCGKAFYQNREHIIKAYKTKDGAIKGMARMLQSKYVYYDKLRIEVYTRTVEKDAEI